LSAQAHYFEKFHKIGTGLQNLFLVTKRLQNEMENDCRIC